MNLGSCVLELKLLQERQASVPLIYPCPDLTQPIGISSRRVLFIFFPHTTVCISYLMAGIRRKLSKSTENWSLGSILMIYKNKGPVSSFSILT